jgi:hypothetical protein
VWIFASLWLAVQLGDAPLLESVEVVDEGKALVAVQELPIPTDAAVVAVVVRDTDSEARFALTRTLIRVLDRCSVVGRASSADAIASDVDHVLLVDVVRGDVPTAVLRMLRAGDAQVRGQTQLALFGASPVKPPSLEAAARDVMDSAAVALEEQGTVLLLSPVAILPPEATIDSDVVTVWQQALVSAALRRRFAVVERDKLIETLRDNAAASPTAAGGLAGAEFVVLSQLLPVADQLQVTTRVVRVQTGVVVSSSSTSLPREGVVRLAQVEQRTPTDAALSSLLLPGAGQVQNGDVGRGVAFTIVCGGLLLGTIGLGVASGFQVSSYQTATNPADASSARDVANALMLGTAGALAATAGCWGINVVDAFVSAPQPAR